MIIDKDGIKIDDFNTIYDRLANGLKAIYGEDLNLDQDTPDGQQIGIYSNVIYDLQSLVAKTYNGFDPDLAEGFELDRLMKLISSIRLPGTKSTVDVEVTVSANVFLPATYKVKDDNDQVWVIASERRLNAGTTTITFLSEDWGAIGAITGAINEQVVIFTEVDKIYNPTPAVEGREGESDIDLRIRRNKLVGYRATSLIGSISGKLLNLSDVKDVVAYENNTTSHDPIKDIPAHTMWLVIDGGTVDELAKVIAQDKTVGCGLKGAIHGTYKEEIKNPDGSVRFHVHEVQFDRPIETHIHIRFNVSKKNQGSTTDIIDTVAMKRDLAKKEYYVGQAVNATELYSIIYGAGNTFIAGELELSADGVIWVDDRLLSGFGERLIIDPTLITITEV